MKKLHELAQLLANPVLPKASRDWSGADVVIASAPQADHLRSSFYPRNRKVLTEHALEVSYFFEVLRDHFHEESLIDRRSNIEFFGRLAAAADACLLEQPDATAHLVCAVILREAYAMAKLIDESELDLLIVAEGNQIADDRALPGQGIGYSSIKETIDPHRIQENAAGLFPGPVVPRVNHPRPGHFSVTFLVSAVSSKVAAANMTDKTAADQIITAADQAIAAFIDSDDICPRWPYPGPPPWLSIIASELTLVANTFQEGSLRTGLLQVAGQVLDRVALNPQHLAP